MYSSAVKLSLSLLWLLLGGSVQADATTPARVVSINLCTDQLLLMLADPEQVASISYLARDPESSFVSVPAQTYPINHARLEELIVLQPDLVLAGSHSDPRLLRQLQTLSISVVQFPLASSFAGITANIQHLAELLGRTQQGNALIEQLETRLAEAQFAPAPNPPKAIFYQPRGYTSGQHTLQDTALSAAGWRNLAAELGIQGYAPIDLERLLLAEPDQLFTSTHGSGTGSRAQQRLQHPALQRLLLTRPIREIPFKYWICGGPMIVEAIAALRDAHEQ